MSDYTRQQTPNSPPPVKECPKEPVDPADQPKDPGSDCQPTPPPDKPPEPPEIPECPPSPCRCPQTPPADSNCIEDLIKAQNKEITEAERAKSFKTELEALLAKAKTAKQDYTVDKYKKLLDEWKKRDKEICELIHKIVCAVPCWWCLIECHICPFLYAIGDREKKLWGDGKLYSDVGSLYDLRYWHERNRDAKRKAFDRIKKVLAAWDTPAKTIEKVLADNGKLIEDAGKFLAPDAAKLVYDVFLKLVPLHLAIAPPASSGVETCIDRKYDTFCKCDEGKADDCCGPDVGRLSVRDRLIGPLPYLVHPDQFYAVICCIVKLRYLPAKDALAEAESGFATVDGEITQYLAEIDAKLKSLEADAKAALPTPVNCDDYGCEDHDTESPAPTTR